MAHHIPKIVYGTLNTTIELPYPGQGFGEREQLDVSENVLVSLSGQRQVQMNFVEATKKAKFMGLSEAKVDSLKSFFLTHACYGKTFRYYENKDGSDYTTYELAELKFLPKRTGIAGENVFTYELPVKLRRVEDDTLVDYIEAEIANNQSSAANVTGLTLDSSSYKSVKIFCELRRKTDTTEKICNGYLTAIYSVATASWAITAEGTMDGDDDGVTFSMSGAQVQYTSDNMSGGNYTGTMRIKSLTI